MSIAGISSSDLFSAQSVQKQMQEMRQEFQQLGSDLQSGNLSGAQSDFATLTQLDPNLASSSSTSSTSSTAAATSSTASNPMQQAFAQLAKDLQSGNLSAAQQDFTAIQQAMQSSSAAHGHHHHHHSESSQRENPISQLFSQLGQDLQSGNLTAAQQDFTSLQQQFQQNAQNNLQVRPEVGPNAVSVTA